MIIALDATPLTVPTGGVARYTSELARALAARFPENEYWLLSDRQFPMPDPRPAHPGSPRRIPSDLHLTNLKKGDPPRTFLGRRWWSVGLLREMKRCRADLFHGTDFSTPYVPMRPSVMTVHDLSPWLHEKHDPHSKSDRPWQPDSARVRRRTATPFFLFVGTLEPRKNISGLIEAWREVRQTHDIDLVIAGRARADFPPLDAEPGLRVLGPVPDEDLPELYSTARAVVYPSFYEGFGLPVLEAMQCGAIVVTSRDPAIMEVAGDAAIFVTINAARDIRELAATLASIAEAPHNFAPLRERALRRAKQFSWRRTAELTQEVYAEACRVFRH